MDKDSYLVVDEQPGLYRARLHRGLLAVRPQCRSNARADSSRMSRGDLGLGRKLLDTGQWFKPGI